MQVRPQVLFTRGKLRSRKACLLLALWRLGGSRRGVKTSRCRLYQSLMDWIVRGRYSNRGRMGYWSVHRRQLVGSLSVGCLARIRGMDRAVLLPSHQWRILGVDQLRTRLDRPGARSQPSLVYRRLSHYIHHAQGLNRSLEPDLTCFETLPNRLLPHSPLVHLHVTYRRNTLPGT